MNAIIPIFFATLVSSHAALLPAKLRVEWLPEPLAVESSKPRLSWGVEESDAAVRNQLQTAYRIIAASDEAVLAKDTGDLWDTGKVASGETLNIEYAGKRLASRQQIFWKVRIWDRDGKESKWSEPARWGMGMLKPEDWKAQWISFKDESPLHADRSSLFLPPARYYKKWVSQEDLYERVAAPSGAGEKVFSLKEKPVKRAMLYTACLGIADFYATRYWSSRDYFGTGWSDYRQRVYYRAYDLTKELRNKHAGFALMAHVADGWYSGYVGYGLLVGYGPNKTGRNIYGKTPAVLMQLEIEFEDGSRKTIGTDATWQTSDAGPYREADLLMGVNYDARLSDPYLIYGSPSSDFSPRNDWKWTNAIPATDNVSTKAKFYEPGVEREVELGFQKPARLVPYTAPPIRITEELPAKRITEPSPGVYIFDFGQNFAGNIRLKIRGESGQKVTLRYGEMLHPDGRLMTENLRKARATDTYICRGGDHEEAWTPRFTYHGFQFCEVSGLKQKPTLEMLTGLVLNNDTPFESSFACSDPVMTQFWKNSVRTQKANFIEVPTDCPQRDERLGWMGDAQLYARTATYNADVAAFYTKWIDDVREAQRPNGAYPDYAPYPFAHGAPGATHAAGWTDAGILVPFTMWHVYGDKRIVERHWASMVKFMEWRAKMDPELKGVKIGNTWGDWLNVNEDTPIEFIDMCYHMRDLCCMTDMLDSVMPDERELHEVYWDRIGKLQRNFEKQYIRDPDKLSVDTQTAYALALSTYCVTNKHYDALTKTLAKKIAQNDFRMSTGFIGTKPLLDSLSVRGEHDLACRLFLSRKFPSWGYEVEQGATSVWERWDSFTKENGFNGATGKNNAAMNSFSHYSFGSVMEWAFDRLAGIGAGGGFKAVTFEPMVPAANGNGGESLTWVRAEWSHPRGKTVSQWKRKGDRIEYEFVVPPNVQATIILRAADIAAVSENGQAVPKSMVTDTSAPLKAVFLKVGSGTYHFEVRAAK